MLNYFKIKPFFIKNNEGFLQEINNGTFLLEEDLNQLKKELLFYKESFERLNSELDECKIISDLLTAKI
jgi:hypothetical protein